MTPLSATCSSRASVTSHAVGGGPIGAISIYLRETRPRLDRGKSDGRSLARRPRVAVPPDLRIARRLASRMVAAGHEDVRRVVFYGSRARGTASPASDWDFVIVLRDGVGGMEALEASLRQAALDGEKAAEQVGVAPFRLDVWLVEQAEWESARQLHGHPIRTAEREGKVLYGAG